MASGSRSPTQQLRRKLQLSALGLGNNEAVSEQVCEAAAAFEFTEIGPLPVEVSGGLLSHGPRVGCGALLTPLHVRLLRVRGERGHGPVPADV